MTRAPILDPAESYIFRAPLTTDFLNKVGKGKTCEAFNEETGVETPGSSALQLALIELNCSPLGTLSL